jgi:HD superfamily phosphohydrolase YqeK
MKSEVLAGFGRSLSALAPIRYRSNILVNGEGKHLRDGDLKYFRNWFRGFCRTYYRNDRMEQMNIVLKEEHSFHVADNAVVIAKGELFGADRCLIAEVAALFHDIGRFPQYAQYRTFMDSISVNHGQLGAETLISQYVLASLSQKERDMIINAVRFHNAFAIHEKSDYDTLLLIKLVRDADKIDIWRVVCDYYEESGEEKADAVSLGLPGLPDYSKEAVATIMEKKVVKLAHIRTLNDLKLLQLSWVFDLNYRSSFRLVNKRGSIRRMAAVLPGTDDVAKAVSIVQTYVSERAV